MSWTILLLSVAWGAGVATACSSDKMGKGVAKLSCSSRRTRQTPAPFP